MKILYKENMTEEDVKTLLEEISILSQLDHPSIIKMFEYFEDEKRYYLIMEYCSGGELFDEIINQGKFSELLAAQVMRQIFSSILFFHEKNIVHRDLKPENILLEQGKDMNQIKIIDFGISVHLEPGETLSEPIGTPYYIAPEVWEKEYG
jgi:calcium-dependent protein kinase